MNAIFFYAIIGLILPMGNLAASLADIIKQIHDSTLNPTIRNQFVFPKDAKSDIGARIIGGVEVTPHSYPFQAGLLIFNNNTAYFCGGTLIKPQWVLTAAHCLDNDPNYVLVVLGAHNLTSIESNVVILNATQFVVHQNWSEDLLVNDVGLIKLPYEVPLTENIGITKYAEGNNTYFNETGTTLGWGKTETTEGISPVLKSVNSTIMSNEECAEIDPFGQILTESHICVKGYDSGIALGSCDGDSGGPLLVDGVQVGIVSFGYVNCLLGKPSVFTRLTEFHDWIDQHTEADS